MIRVAFLILVVGLSAGCLSEPGSRCGEGVCGPGKACDVLHSGCVDPAQLSECSGQADLSDCMYPGVEDGACFDGVCFPRGCGNGELEEGEACDDGNNLFGDDCSADCLSDETCGNGVIDSAQAEACDDGNTIDGDGCQANCVLANCGDGILDPFENCDEGAANSDTPDATCRSNCQPQRCGDGIIDITANEVCDDGNLLTFDGCTPDCFSDETCGNSIVDPHTGEECDDGNFLSGDSCGQCRFETLVWTELASLPTSRNKVGATFDPTRGVVLVFGGRDLNGSSSSTLGDLWEWDGHQWIERHSSPSPPPRRNGALTYAGNGKSVLVGGDNVIDFWEWNGQSWKQFVDLEIPSVSEAAVAYDAARERVVLFGTSTLGAAETWEWNGATWTMRSPSNSPPPRAQHGMAFDASRNQVVLFGGTNLADTWEWDGSDWTEVLTPTSPGPREGRSLVYDPIRERVMLFGGDDFLVPDLWAFDGATWTEESPPGDLPPNGIENMIAFDTRRGRLVLPVDDHVSSEFETWEWDGSTWEQIGLAAAPPSSANAVLDKLRGRALVLSDDGELWGCCQQGWELIDPGGPITEGQLAYDSARDRVVFFGRFRETWEFDGTSWQQLVVQGPDQSRRAFAMAYDEARGVTVLFGGSQQTITGTTFFDDTWLWDGSSWTQASPPTSPPRQSQHTMAFDEDRDVVVLFGADGHWEWGGTTWVERLYSVGPETRRGATLSFDPLRRRVALFGGTPGGAEVWEWDGVAWSASQAARQPGERRDHFMTYLPQDARMLVGNGSDSGHWSHRFSQSELAVESCRFGVDMDSDGLIGCDDPDCWGYCTPLCPPGTVCDPAAPQCGDLVCNTFLENCRLCPGDCGACPEVCGDFLCDAGEDNASCPADCQP